MLLGVGFACVCEGGGGAEGVGGCRCDVCVCVERKVNLKQRCVLLAINLSVCLFRKKQIR